MEKIEVVETFIHDGQIYRIGEIRQVGEGLAYYFVGHGWAKFVDNSGDNEATFNKLPDGPVDLNIHNITQESQ